MGKDVLGGFEHQVLLSILRLDDETYTVPIVLELEERTGRETAPAAVYIALRRLEKKGLVASRLDDGASAKGSRKRRLVRLTDDGLEALRESRRSLVGLWDGVEERLDGLK
jgi:DNA-binding PadR family transcriptional regulator